MYNFDNLWKCIFPFILMNLQYTKKTIDIEDILICDSFKNAA